VTRTLNKRADIVAKNADEQTATGCGTRTRRTRPTAYYREAEL